MAFSLKKKLPFEKRAQSVPYKKPFIYAAFLGGACYLLILGLLVFTSIKEQNYRQSFSLAS